MTINLIRGRALNHRLFKSLCQDYGSEHSVLLFHTEVRWLSRGRALTRFFELRNEVKDFLKERDYGIIKEMESKELNQILAYLSDLFSCLNNTSVSLQGINVNILKCREIINAFKKKLNLWCRRVEGGNLSNFPLLEEVTDEDECLVPSVREEIMNHLEILSKSFDGYFKIGELEISEEWIINPYSFNLNHMSDDELLKDELIELCNDRLLKCSLKSKLLKNIGVVQ